MECDEVRDRLVALHDDELSRSEAVQVREHLVACPACARADRRLRSSVPSRPFVADDALRARLAEALDPALILAMAARPVEPPPPPRPRLWQIAGRAASVPVGAVVVYVVLLAASFGWGVSNWWSLQIVGSGDPAGVASGAAAGVAPSVETASPAGTAIPADQFRPAAWDPTAPEH
jgi:anti-sigma factor RsiW